MSKQTETMTAIANKIADLMETNGTDWPAQTSSRSYRIAISS